MEWANVYNDSPNHDLEIEHQEVSEEEKRAAFSVSALQSDSLGRSDRLNSLLSYICEAEFAGHHERLTEYEIPVSALGRRGDFYHWKIQPSGAGPNELRQKLEWLYTVEAPTYPCTSLFPKETTDTNFAFPSSDHLRICELR